MNDKLIEQCNAVADALQKRGNDITYHEHLAYNDMRMAAQNLKWANEKRAEAEKLADGKKPKA